MQNPEVLVLNKSLVAHKRPLERKYPCTPQPGQTPTITSPPLMQPETPNSLDVSQQVCQTFSPDSSSVFASDSSPLPSCLIQGTPQSTMTPQELPYSPPFPPIMHQSQLQSPEFQLSSEVPASSPQVSVPPVGVVSSHESQLPIEQPQLPQIDTLTVPLSPPLEQCLHASTQQSQPQFSTPEHNHHTRPRHQKHSHRTRQHHREERISPSFQFSTSPLLSPTSCADMIPTPDDAKTPASSYYRNMYTPSSVMSPGQFPAEFMVGSPRPGYLSIQPQLTLQQQQAAASAAAATVAAVGSMGVIQQAQNFADLQKQKLSPQQQQQLYHQLQMQMHMQMQIQLQIQLQALQEQALTDPNAAIHFQQLQAQFQLQTSMQMQLQLQMQQQLQQQQRDSEAFPMQQNSWNNNNHQLADNVAETWKEGESLATGSSDQGGDDSTKAASYDDGPQSSKKDPAASSSSYLSDSVNSQQQQQLLPGIEALGPTDQPPTPPSKFSNNNNKPSSSPPVTDQLLPQSSYTLSDDGTPVDDVMDPLRLPQPTSTPNPSPSPSSATCVRLGAGMAIPEANAVTGGAGSCGYGAGMCSPDGKALL
ncbi:hypothetical protein Pelo_7545 [Pelomyxa schiedti]|nr:hypothetical protein Pelo_7545 [Pelomyxa schiedti]